MGTPNRHDLLLLRLPGNVERTVNRIRDSLFAVSAAVSTQGLPPIIPLAYVNDAATEALADGLPQTEIPPVEIGSIESSPNAVFIGIGWSGHWTRFLDGIGARRNADSAPEHMPAPMTGIYLGGSDLATCWSGLETGQRALIVEQKDTTMPDRMSVLHIEVHAITVTDDAAWWDHMDWRACWSRRIKLRGQIVTT